MQPLEEAAREGPEAGAGADNPFAALFQPAGSGGAGAGDAGQQPAGAPNEAPLPNPWAAGGGGGAAGGAAGGGGAAGLGGLPGLGGMGGMPGLDPAQMQQVGNPRGLPCPVVRRRCSRHSTRRQLLLKSACNPSPCPARTHSPAPRGPLPRS